MRSHTDPMHWSEDDMKKFLSSVSVSNALLAAAADKQQAQLTLGYSATSASVWNTPPSTSYKPW